MNRCFDKVPIISKKIPGKITLSFLMLIFALLLFLIFQTVDRGFCLLAMTFSFIGDIALNQKRDHAKQSTKDFIIGGIAFMVAHLFYCITYYIKLSSMHFRLFNLGCVFALVLLVIISIVFLMGASHKQRQSKLFYFGLLYLWLTGIDYIIIFSYAYSARSTPQVIVCLGGLSFLTSDLIIGAERFLNVKSQILRELVWWFYPIGQILLIAMA